jgi:hypothetical protein
LDKDHPAVIEINSYRWTFVGAIEGTTRLGRFCQILRGSKPASRFQQQLDELVEIVAKLPCEPINYPIGLKLGLQNKVVLFSRVAGTEKFTEATFCAAEVKGGPVTICLNRNYLIKALRFGLTEIQIADPLSPIRCSDESGRQMIIMPIRLDGMMTTSPTQPSSPAPREAQSSATNKNEMQNANRNDGQTVTLSRENKKSSLEIAVEQIDAVRSSIKTAAASLHDVITSLKQAQRERSTEKKSVGPLNPAKPAASENLTSTKLWRMWRYRPGCFLTNKGRNRKWKHYYNHNLAMRIYFCTAGLMPLIDRSSVQHLHQNRLPRGHHFRIWHSLKKWNRS